MKEYKEKDKRADEIIETLDFYYDEDHPLQNIVNKVKIEELITILREEYGIFYAPKITHSMANTMEKYRMDICNAIGVEKVWCWSTTIEEVKTLKRRYNDLLKKYNKLVEGGHLNDDQYVTIPRENYDILVEESCHLDRLMNILEEDYCIHNFTSRDAFIKDMNSYVHYREELCLKEYELELTEKADNKSDLDLLFEELKNLEKDSKEDKRWGTNVWLKSIIKKEEESNGEIHTYVDCYIYHKAKDITESFRYTIRKDRYGYLYVLCYNPYHKITDLSIQNVLNYIGKEMEHTKQLFDKSDI